MSLKKSFGFLSLGALMGAISYGCSSSTTTNGLGGDDAGSTDAKVSDAKHDVGAATDGGNTGDDGGNTASCAPGDVSTFMPTAYKPAVPHAPKCTVAQIANFYDACLAVNATMTTCAPYNTGGTPALIDCAKCLITADTATAYGALIEHKGTVGINVAGCMELKDPTNGPTCAKAYQAADQCNDAACAANCPVSDDASFQLYEACVQQAAGSGCSMYSQAAACANAEADGGAASTCFSGTSFQELYTSVAPIFCGP